MASLPFFCHVAGLSPSVGLLAGVLGLLPFRVWMETKGAWDTHLNALLVISVSIAVMCWMRAPSFRVKESIVHGLLWGFALLATPSLLTFALLLSLLGFFVIERANRLKYFRFLLCCVVAAFVVLLPWSIRNFNQIGGVFFVRDSMGLELYSSNNDKAGVSLGENTSLGDARPHPFHNKNEFMELQRLGEIQYMQSKRESAVQWILSNPARFANMTMKRVVLFWFPWLDSNWKRLGLWTVVVLGFIGMMLVLRGTSASRLILMLWLSYPVVYYIVQADPRYSYPIYWSILVPAGALMVRLYPFSNWNSHQ